MTRSCNPRRQFAYRDTLLYEAIEEYCLAMEKRGWLTIIHTTNCRSVQGRTCDCEPAMKTTEAFENATDEEKRQFSDELAKQ